MKTLQNGPLQYQRGYCEFYKLKFRLTPDVLIPRPESELLVDEVLAKIKNLEAVTVVDIGTGSGNIAVSIAKNLASLASHLGGVRTKIFATDISEKALAVARLNAKLNGVEDKIFFVQSDLLEFLNPSMMPETNRLILVSNLPYIPTGRILYLDPLVTEFEPRIALDGGKDGFELYRRLFSQMVEKKIIPEYLIAEIDYTHADIAIHEATMHFPRCSAEVKLDLCKKQRILLVWGFGQGSTDCPEVTV